MHFVKFYQITFWKIEKASLVQGEALCIGVRVIEILLSNEHSDGSALHTIAVRLREPQGTPLPIEMRCTIICYFS